MLMERGVDRYTPAGLLALDLTLKHEGQAQEAGGLRKVTFEMRAVAFGPQAKALGQWPLGQLGDFAGFLGATRNGKGVVLHITQFSKAPSCTLQTE